MTRTRLALGRADEIGEGRARGFDIDEDGEEKLFVVRTDGVLRAWRDACPHIDGAPMAWRRDAYLNEAGARIVCHAHGAEFLPESRGSACSAPASASADGGELIIDEGGLMSAELE